MSAEFFDFVAILELKKDSWPLLFSIFDNNKKLLLTFGLWLFIILSTADAMKRTIKTSIIEFKI